MDRFIESIRLGRVAMYVFDDGAPTGFRPAMWHPERMSAPERLHVIKRVPKPE